MNLSTLPVFTEERFSVFTLLDRERTLTFDQRTLLTAVWNHLVTSDRAFPIRSVPGVIGRQPLQQVLRNLSGGLIFEIEEQGDRYLKLTMHGALLTECGGVLASLLIRLLNLAKTRFEQDSLIKEMKSDEIIEKLSLEPEEARSLFLLLQLGLPPHIPVGISGWSADKSSWQIRVTDEIIDLFNSDNTAEFLDDKLSAGYRRDDLCLIEDRHEKLQGISSSSITEFGSESSRPFFSYGEVTSSSYIEVSRIKKLKAISSPRFDCTRLVALCDELNMCAAQKNPHAVILLVRTILNHVPPAFGFTDFKQVAANYSGGGSSFKKAVERLENHSRRVADRLAHMPIRDKEVAPTMAEVAFAAEIETILSEFCRILK